MTTIEAVRKAIMGRWMTSKEVEDFVYIKTGKVISGSNCTARIRELRNPKHGAHRVECRHLHGNRFEYRIERSK